MNTETLCREARINYIYAQAKIIATQLAIPKCDQDDLVQEAMVRALDNYHKIPLPEQDTFYWLRTVMRNMRIDEIRKLKKRRLARPDIATTEKPDTDMQSQDVFDFLRQQQRNGRGGIREFVLFVKGYKIREISENEKVNMETVKGRIFRTRNLLIEYSKN